MGICTHATSIEWPGARLLCLGKETCACHQAWSGACLVSHLAAPSWHMNRYVTKTHCPTPPAQSHTGRLCDASVTLPLWVPRPYQDVTSRRSPSQPKLECNDGPQFTCSCVGMRAAELAGNFLAGSSKLTEISRLSSVATVPLLTSCSSLTDVERTAVLTDFRMASDHMATTLAIKFTPWRSPQQCGTTCCSLACTVSGPETTHTLRFAIICHVLMNRNGRY